MSFSTLNVSYTFGKLKILPMSSKILIQPTEKKNIILGIKISNRERLLIDKFCDNNQIRKTDLVRFAIKQLIPTL